MIRHKEGRLPMTKVSLLILMVLNDNDITTASKSLSIGQIIALMTENQRKSYSTIYRHLCSMVKKGYVKCGLDDALADTYYVTEAGQAFCAAQFN